MRAIPLVAIFASSLLAGNAEAQQPPLPERVALEAPLDSTPPYNFDGNSVQVAFGWEARSAGIGKILWVLPFMIPVNDEVCSRISSTSGRPVVCVGIPTMQKVIALEDAILAAANAAPVDVAATEAMKSLVLRIERLETEIAILKQALAEQ